MYQLLDMIGELTYELVQDLWKPAVLVSLWPKRETSHLHLAEARVLPLKQQQNAWFPELEKNSEAFQL